MPLHTVILLIGIMGGIGIANRANAFSDRDVTVTNRNIVFSKVGETAASLKYAGIHVDMDIVFIIETIDTILDLPNPNAARKPFYFSWMGRRLNTLKNRAIRLNSFFRSMEEMHKKNSDRELDADTNRKVAGRPKRFIFTAIAITVALVAIASIGIGISIAEFQAGTARYRALAEAADGLYENQLVLGHNQDSITRYVNETLIPAMEAGQIRRMEEELLEWLSDRLTMMETTFDAAVQGRVSHAALRELDLVKTTKLVTKQAKIHDMVPLAQHASDWLAFDVSWSATLRGFDLIIHVPLVADSGTLPLYRFDSMPIPLGDNVHLVIHSSEKRFIAIDTHRRHFRVLSTADLQDCRKVGVIYMCDRGNVLRKAPSRFDVHAQDSKTDEEMCLYSLITQQYDVALKVCETELGRPGNSVVMIGASRFITYSAGPIQAQLHCTNQRQAGLKAFSLHGLQTVDLPVNCYATTETHIFQASDEIFSRDAHEWNIVYEWPEPQKMLEARLTSTDISLLRANFDRLFTNSSKTVPLDIAMQQVHKWASEASWSDLVITHLPSALLVILGLATAVLAWGLKGVREKMAMLERYNIQAASSTPLSVFQQVVAPEAPPSYKDKNPDDYKDYATLTECRRMMGLTD